MNGIDIYRSGYKVGPNFWLAKLVYLPIGEFLGSWRYDIFLLMDVINQQKNNLGPPCMDMV